MSVPWRIAAQAYTVLHPETKEPVLTLQFITDHQQADVSRLRIVPAGEAEGNPAIEVEFATGGWPTGPAVLQPRWLRAFERPMPVNGEQRVALAKRREAWLNDARSGSGDAQANGSYTFREPSEADLKAYEQAHPEPKEGDVPNVGPDGVADGEERPGPDGKVIEAHEKGVAAPQQQKDAFVPEGAAVKQAGVDVTSPGDADRKGMVGVGPGNEAGPGPATAPGYNPSPGITPAPGGAYATPLPGGVSSPQSGGPGPAPGSMPPASTPAPVDANASKR